jgi:hypothetical protein
MLYYRTLIFVALSLLIAVKSELNFTGNVQIIPYSHSDVTITIPDWSNKIRVYLYGAGGGGASTIFYFI